jgi:hypothetical protein
MKQTLKDKLRQINLDLVMRDLESGYYMLSKKNIDQILELIKEEVEDIKKKFKKVPELGLVKRAFLRVETVKEGDLGMAYEDGYLRALDDLLKVL